MSSSIIISSSSNRRHADLDTLSFGKDLIEGIHPEFIEFYRKCIDTSLNDPCPICNEGTLSEVIEIDEFGVPMKYSVCSACGSEQASPEQMKWNKKTAERLSRS